LFFPQVIIFHFTPNNTINYLNSMKSSYLLFNLASIALLISPTAASQLQALPANQSPATENAKSVSNNRELPPLPNIQFIPPKTQPTIVNPRDTPTNNGFTPSGKQMLGVDNQIKALMKKYNSLAPGMFFVDLQTGDYLDINGDKAFPAASTIKLPILIALFQDIEAGKIRLDETLVMRRDLVAGGSGNMQSMRTGSKFTVLQTATKMMTISDNTATNMIIDRLGGFKILNQRFQSLGLRNTALRHLLADVQGTNTTSAKDLVQLSGLLANSQVLNDASRSQILDIMRRCQNRSLLPSGLGTGAVIAHKTGTLRFVLGDAGIIQTASGKRYLAGILVRRPNHDPRAKSFIRQVSSIMYNYMDNTQQFTSEELKIKG
jgi:beta-lactamase class A